MVGDLSIVVAYQPASATKTTSVRNPLTFLFLLSYKLEVAARSPTARWTAKLTFSRMGPCSMKPARLNLGVKSDRPR